jgi:predicted phage terminase large subunit-like protein
MRLDEIKERIKEIGFELNKRRSKNDLIHFIRKIKESIGHSYIVNWHHEEIARHLERSLTENALRMMIWVPPQYGKSELVSRALPAWLLGHNPRLKIILASYAAELAEGFNRDVQKIIESGTYNDIFPDTVFTRTTARESQTSKGGYLYAIGVGGATTGKSADVIIVDDPFKDWKSTQSKSHRNDVHEWFQSVATTRLSKNGHLIVMHTRWHTDDLAGRLLKAQEEDEVATKYDVISIPAMGSPESKYRYVNDHREKGQALWPEFKGDEQALLSIRKDLGEKIFASLYQQSPIIQGGNIIKEEWLHYYTELPCSISSMRHNNTIISWDMNFKESGNSYVCGIVIMKWMEHFYIVDCYHEKVGITETLKAVEGLKKKYPYSTILIEDKANGSAVMDLLKTKIPGMVPIQPDAKKDERLEIVAPLFEQGLVLLPFNAAWVRKVVDELQSFPNSQNDDIVDAISQGLSHFNKLSGSRRLEAMSRL